MKLITGIAKWAVTIQGSGDSPGWAGFFFFFFPTRSALAQSGVRETEGDSEGINTVTGRRGKGDESKRRGEREGKKDSK